MNHVPKFFGHKTFTEHYFLFGFILTILTFYMLRILIDYSTDQFKNVIKPPLFPNQFFFRFIETGAIITLFLGTVYSMINTKQNPKYVFAGFIIILILVMMFNYLLFWKDNMLEVAIGLLFMTGLVVLWVIWLTCGGAGVIIYWLFFIKLLVLAGFTFVTYIINIPT